MFAFTGSRSLNPSFRPMVKKMVLGLQAAGHSVTVGCAPGLDSFVRSTPGFSGTVHTATSRHASALVQRSAGMVQSVVASPKSVKALFAFPGCACPSGLKASSVVSQCFCGKGSGSWATVALAVGLGLPVFVFGVKHEDLPLCWGGWEISSQFGHLCFRCPTAPKQLSLF